MEKAPSDSGDSKQPMTWVSWYDAVECCNKLSRAEGLTPCYSGSESSSYSCNFNANGYRLPTEAEWEYAAREGKYHSSYKYSGSNDIASVALYSGNSWYPYAVMTKAPNRIGLYDMSGNVWEWCWDKYSSSTSGRVFRGGSANSPASSCTVSYRNYYDPVYQNGDMGFRLVRSSQ